MRMHIRSITGMWDCTTPDKRVAVVGSRTIDDIDTVFEFLDEITHVKMFISGGAQGVDYLAELYTKCHDIPIQIIKTEIVNAATHLIAFWDGQSKDTMDSVRKAQERGISWQLIELK